MPTRTLWAAPAARAALPQVMATRAAQQALTNGRVVLVSDRGTGLTELGVVCAPEEGGGGSGGKRGAQRGGGGSGFGGLGASAATGEELGAHRGRMHEELGGVGLPVAARCFRLA